MKAGCCDVCNYGEVYGCIQVLLMVVFFCPSHHPLPFLAPRPVQHFFWCVATPNASGLWWINTVYLQRTTALVWSGSASCFCCQKKHFCTPWSPSACLCPDIHRSFANREHFSSGNGQNFVFLLAN